MRRITHVLLALSLGAGALLLSPRSASAQGLDFGGIDLGSIDLSKMDPELQKLVKFWTVERLLIDANVPVREKPFLQSRVLAKAQPDECFDGVGKPYPPLSYDENGRPVCNQGVEKTNQAYVWGLTKSNNYLYFGTLANTHCLVESSYLNVTAPMDTPYWVCEFGAGAAKSDFRPPKIYRYKLASGPLEELSVSDAAKPLLQSTIGIRSAGAINGVVFFAGLSARGGVNFFGFDGKSGTFLGAKNFAQYSDIRQWMAFEDVLYTTVGSYVTACKGPGGKVLRWMGKNSTDPAVLFDFREVGDLDAPGAYLVELNRRIYISTWPSGGKSGCVDATGKPVSDYRYVGIVRGPRIPYGGLTEAHKSAALWKKVWSITDYEPDLVCAASTGGGALAAYGGMLFWGTMAVPFSAATHAMATVDVDPANDGIGTDDLLQTALGTHRSISIFRASFPDSERPQVDILYGELFLPTYNPTLQKYTIAYDAAHMNKMRRAPKFGASGFGNFWNTYTWTMDVYKGRLFVGTFDWSQLARVGIADVAGLPVSMTPTEFPLLEKIFGATFPVEGADLLRFDTPYTRAKAESLDGLGNFTNYGFRTVINAGGKMYIGSANPMNLHPMGGWELIETKPLEEDEEDD